MIEETSESLRNLGFQEAGGKKCDAVYTPDLYYIKESPDKRCTLVMKEAGGYYYPHRAKDKLGREYSELVLLCNTPFSDLEHAKDLWELLQAPEQRS